MSIDAASSAAVGIVVLGPASLAVPWTLRSGTPVPVAAVMKERRRLCGEMRSSTPLVSSTARQSGDHLDVRDAIAELAATHKFIRPHCPWQNGKVERFNRNLQIEWAYRQVFESNDDRTAALPDFLLRYNHHRRHHALGGQAPISRLSSAGQPM